MLTTVLITSGNTRAAQHLIPELLALKNGPHLRVLVWGEGTERLKSAYPLLARPPHTIVTADFTNERTLASVFRDVTVVVHNAPAALRQHDVGVSVSFIDAAKNARVQHFVLCSVLHPIRTKLITHKVMLQVEEYLVESRLNYTILQPAHYMQNVSLSNVSRTGKLKLGYSNLLEQGFLDLRDFTQVLRSIVLDPQPHTSATYELVGQNIPHSEVAKLLAETMQRSVECEVISLKLYIEMMTGGNALRSEHAEDAIERTLLNHDRWGLTGNSNVLRWLLGREPTTRRQYAAEMIYKA